MQPSSATRRVVSLARAQHGNVTIDQLRDAGLSRQEIRTRVGRGWLVRRHTGVYAVGYVPRDRPSRWSAAVLALPDSALSHRACGAHWNVVRGAVPTEVTVPTSAGRRRRDGIVIHRAPLPPEHVTVRDGIRMTTLLRAILDLATVLDVHALARAFEEAQVRHHLSPEPLAAEVLCRRGFRGNARLATILDGAVDPAGVLSILELRFLRLCAAHGIPTPLVNERLGRWMPDFLWPDAGIAVETDGADFHRTAAARRRDARKDAALTAAGLTVVRLRWTDVVERGADTAALVRRALAGGASGA